jgi:hypothetical protein
MASKSHEPFPLNSVVTEDHTAFHYVQKTQKKTAINKQLKRRSRTNNSKGDQD